MPNPPHSSLKKGGSDSRHTEEQHLQSAECWLKTQAVCKTFQPNVDTFNANVVIGNEESHKRGDFTNFAILRVAQEDENSSYSRHTERKRKYPVTNTKELSCKNSNYIEINKKLDCFGSKEPHNVENSRYSRYSECNEESHSCCNLRGYFAHAQYDVKEHNVGYKRERVAFTLAEVLITLGIIGVVAAITIPMLITSYQKQVTVTKLKKVYSNLSNAAERAIADHGDMNTWDFPVTSYYDDKFIPFFRKYYIPYLNVLDECVEGNCLYKNNYSPTYYNGQMSGAMYVGYLVKLVDGTYLYFLSNVNAGYIWLFADINGKNKPNVFGKDIFVFDIYNYRGDGYKVKFWNINSSVEYLAGTQNYGCNKNATAFAGFNCGALIQKNNWKIPDNFPW